MWEPNPRYRNPSAMTVSSQRWPSASREGNADCRHRIVEQRLTRQAIKETLHARCSIEGEGAL
jgi:hypothetical protein